MERKKKTPPKKSSSKKRPKKSASDVPPDTGDCLDGYSAALSAFFKSVEAPSPAAEKRTRDMQMLCSNMEEYLSSYILIGYTIDEKPVNITFAKTQKDHDSLSTALQRYIMEGYFKGPMGPPGNPF